MKKITIFSLLLILPLITIGQTFNFTNTDDGFNDLVGFTAANGATFMTLTSVDGDGVLKNPSVGTTTAGVNTGAVNFVGVKIRNNNATGPSYIRVSYPKVSSGRIYINLDMTTGDSEFVTYWFDLSNSTNWVGTMNDIKIHFKATGNTDYVLPNAPGNITIDIDKIEFTDTLPRPEKHIYEFNTAGDDEGFSTPLDATSAVAGGNLTLTPSAPGTAIAKVTNGVNSVNASANTHIHIVYQNLSADNNELRVQFRSAFDNYTAFIGTNTSINQSMAAFETISLDLATIKPTEWTGTAQDFQLAVRNTANAGNASSAGDFVVDRIVFNNSATLSVDDLTLSNFTVFPNPAKNNITIVGNVDLTSVSVFDITGKKVIENKGSSINTVNVSNLNSGIYLLKLENINGNITTKKFVKN